MTWGIQNVMKALSSLRRWYHLSISSHRIWRHHWLGIVVLEFFHFHAVTKSSSSTMEIFWVIEKYTTLASLKWNLIFDDIELMENHFFLHDSGLLVWETFFTNLLNLASNSLIVNEFIYYLWTNYANNECSSSTLLNLALNLVLIASHELIDLVGRW